MTGTTIRRFSAGHATREAGLIVFAILFYFAVRGVSEGRVDPAYENARGLLRLERWLGIDWEHDLQTAILDHRLLVDAANWVYVYGHWPVILACTALLYLTHRRQYLLLRNAMIVSGLLGFVFFALLPMAPPRLADPATVDTVTLYSKGYRALQPPALTNQYAAMPSLHAGWNILLGIVLFQTSRNVAVRAFAIAMPVAMTLAVIATGNHYVLDVVVGAVLVLVGFAVGSRLLRRTLDGGERPPGSSAQLGGSSVRSGAPLGELDREAEAGGGAGSAGDRGGRPPLPEPARGSPPEDGGPDSDSVGSMDARESLRPPAAPP